MKRIIIFIFVGVLLILFFMPKGYPGCGGPVCLPEDFERAEEEERNKMCLGFVQQRDFIDADGRLCWGIFIKK